MKNKIIFSVTKSLELNLHLSSCGSNYAHNVLKMSTFVLKKNFIEKKKILLK
jgi:hypothetical protein